MFDSRKGTGGCDCDPSVLPYIYGELGEDERVEFEEHLTYCDLCAQEISAFSSLRLSIGELKEVDPKAVTEPRALPVKASGGYLAGIKELFAGAIGIRILAGAAAAVLLVLLGAAVFTLLESGDAVPPVAESKDKPGDGRSADSGDPEPLEASDPAELVADGAANEGSVEGDQTEKRLTSRSSGSPVNKRKKSPKRHVTAPLREQVAGSQEPPRLSEAASEETEDDSLRLTDLFADLSED